MIKNFKNELKIISTNSKISEKLMIFSIYNELYNSILGDLGDNFIKKYAPFMEKTFELVVTGLNLQENVSVDAEQFMKIYLKLLKKGKLSIMSYAIDIIETFENDLSSFIDASGYVNAIEKFDLPLDIKVNIIAQFREYINNVFVLIIEFYGEENSKELRYSILDMLSVKLEEYLKDSLSQGINPIYLNNNLKPTMVISTKEYLMNKFNNGEFEFNDIKDEYARELFSNFNEIEQKILSMGLICGIAGCEKNDKLKLDEMCKFLGISKLKYIKIALSMGIRVIKLLKKETKKLNDETFDGDIPKKGRK